MIVTQHAEEIHQHLHRRVGFIRVHARPGFCAGAHVAVPIPHSIHYFGDPGSVLAWVIAPHLEFQRIEAVSAHPRLRAFRQAVAHRRFHVGGSERVGGAHQHAARHARRPAQIERGLQRHASADGAEEAREITGKVCRTQEIITRLTMQPAIRVMQRGIQRRRAHAHGEGGHSLRQRQRSGCFDESLMQRAAQLDWMSPPIQ
ncbi:MAG: hypothetical protein BWY76_03309 [bacterium ADurb.Bin429]|nr:MAG: hypothetical protein BWY76_03309 [bacterium ADurb.Bin429]